MNSPCTDIQLLLTEYAAGDLSPAENRIIEDHLATCPSCQEELQGEYRLRNLLGSLPVQSFPNRRPKEKSSPRFNRRFLALAGVAAVLLLAFMVRDYQAPGGSGTEQAGGLESPSNWTRAELDSAQDDLAFSLALTARLIRQSEIETVHQIFGEQIPRVISDSLNKAINTNQGDQG